ncbi:MAG: M20/M25/M40 family metallo-hydrolase, partial [Deltaproteobacteria bacterium]|nr:M20/M25/M40 family metallo-hydrolase [Deltaproteobacteria bacterium]
MKRAALVAALASCVPPQGGTHRAEWISDTSSFGAQPAARATTIADRYAAIATQIITAARADRGAYLKLAHLTDRIGHRLAGSPGLERAVAWAAEAMKQDGHDTRTEKVMVPHWVRGTEDVALVTPVARPLRVLGLGGSVSTPKGGITAPVVVITSFAELDAKAASIKGAIVLYDVALPPYSADKGSGYGDVVPYRSRGASRAAKLGAVAVLVRSVTAHSLQTPHTGAMSYDPDQPKIPAASVTTEDAMLIARLAAQGPVTVRMKLESRQLPDAESANVIGELRGSEKPDEIVVIGAHIDSWDVGQGAHDDGAGCVTMMQALTVLKQLGLAPKRTIRVVLFTNEENGLRGATAYAKDHAAELPKTVFAVESDSGGYSPRMLGLQTKPEVSAPALARITDILTLLRPLGVTRVVPG